MINEVSRFRKKGHSYANCECDFCGHSFEKRLDRLTSKTTCPNCRTLNYIGKKIGNLTIIKKDFDIDENKVMWLCECTCGEYTHIETKSVYKKNKTSCGCKTKRINKASYQHGYYEDEEIKLVKNLVNKKYRGFSREWKEDLLQEAYLALHLAKSNHTEESGKPFMAYANVYISGKTKNYLRDKYNIIKTMRSSDNKKKYPAFKIISSDVPVQSDSDKFIWDIIASDFVVDQETYLSLEPYYELMTDREREIVSYRLQQIPQAEIAKKLEVSQMTISRSLKSLQDKILQQEWFDAI